METFDPLDQVAQKRVDYVCELVGLAPHYIIPSQSMAAGGPIAHSLFLAFENHLLAEVLVATPELLFDVVDVRRLYNVRIEMKTVQAGPQTVVSMAQIDLTHSEQTRARLSYFGTRREEWIKFVLKVIPLRQVLEAP
jgi:hypothetical protein